MHRSRNTFSERIFVQCECSHLLTWAWVKIYTANKVCVKQALALIGSRTFPITHNVITSIIHYILVIHFYFPKKKSLYAAEDKLTGLQFQKILSRLFDFVYTEQKNSTHLLEANFKVYAAFCFHSCVKISVLYLNLILLIHFRTYFYFVQFILDKAAV